MWVICASAPKTADISAAMAPTPTGGGYWVAGGDGSLPDRAALDRVPATIATQFNGEWGGYGGLALRGPAGADPVDRLAVVGGRRIMLR